MNKAHEPLIRVPKVAQDGRVVPVTIDLSGHPMTPDNLLEKMLVSYRGRTVLTYMLTPGVSDNPAVGFYLKAMEHAPVKVTFISNKGRRIEAEEMLMIRG